MLEFTPSRRTPKILLTPLEVTQRLSTQQGGGILFKRRRGAQTCNNPRVNSGWPHFLSLSFCSANSWLYLFNLVVSVYQSAEYWLLIGCRCYLDPGGVGGHVEFSLLDVMHTPHTSQKSRRESIDYGLVLHVHEDVSLNAFSNIGSRQITYGWCDASPFVCFAKVECRIHRQNENRTLWFGSWQDLLVTTRRKNNKVVD